MSFKHTVLDAGPEPFECFRELIAPTVVWNIIRDYIEYRICILLSELISSPPFLIAVAILAILIVIGIAKRAARLLIWITIIFVILICIGIAKQSDLLNWFENLLKMAK